jgi:hypothetical protein
MGLLMDSLAVSGAAAQNVAVGQEMLNTGSPAAANPGNWANVHVDPFQVATYDSLNPAMQKVVDAHERASGLSLCEPNDGRLVMGCVVPHADPFQTA